MATVPVVTGTNQMHRRTVTLDAGQLMILDVTPAVIVPAPGEGKALFIHSMLFEGLFDKAYFTDDGEFAVYVGSAVSPLLDNAPHISFISWEWPDESLIKLGKDLVDTGSLSYWAGAGFDNSGGEGQPFTPSAEMENLPLCIFAPTRIWNNQAGPVDVYGLEQGTQGSGYSGGDQVSLAIGTVNPQFVIDTVDENGEVTGFHVTNRGQGVTVNTEYSMSGGSGSGFGANVLRVLPIDTRLRVTAVYSLIDAN